MTTQEINKERNSNGVFSTSNHVSGWHAFSRDGINMITFDYGKWNFSQKDDVIKFYTEIGFSRTITKLLNGVY